MTCYSCDPDPDKIMKAEYDWVKCLDGMVYGECTSDLCYGVCELWGRCPCECHSHIEVAA
jgi:hypothetical protein